MDFPFIDYFRIFSNSGNLSLNKRTSCLLRCCCIVILALNAFHVPQRSNNMSIDPQLVYVGLWTDYTRGSVLGAVITVPTSVSAVLIASLAIFVQIVGVCLWYLVRFALHQTRVTNQAVHPSTRQIQAILRNDDSATSTAVKLMKLTWRWRGRALPVGATSALAVAAVTFAAAVAVAGVLSSTTISSNGINVLLRSNNCGSWIDLDASLDADRDKFAVLVVSTVENNKLGARYARQCYNTTAPDETCHGFSVSSVPWKTDYSAPCPFAVGMCNGSAMTLDTGRLNSNTILGFNVPANQQIDIRTITTCAPVQQEGFVNQVPFTRTTSYASGVPAAPPSETVRAQASYYLYGSNDGDNFTVSLDLDTSLMNHGYSVRYKHLTSFERYSSSA